jgi:putative ATPase
MKDLGYGSGYAYAHDDPEGASVQQHLPDELAGKKWWRPRD